MADFTVIRFGTDPNGRPIFMTRFMHAWWDAYVAALGFTPTIVQGAFMSRVPGGGADASAGFHDLAGCLDLRVWDLTRKQQKKAVREARRRAAAASLRDHAHGGFDPHIHLVLGPDHPLSPGAKGQWGDYLNDMNGLSGRSRGRDYHWRPDPLVRNWTPPPPAPPKPHGPINLPNVGEQFLNALEKRRVVKLDGVRRIQMLLNLRGEDLATDGIVGDLTLNAWGRFERAGLVTGRPRIPDLSTLTRLVRGSECTITGVVDDTPKPLPPVVRPPAGNRGRIDGIDLYHGNRVTTADLAAFKAAGGRFVHHKATEGTTVVDTLHDVRRAIAESLGLVFGSYHFARPNGGDGVQEARAFLAAAKPRPGDMRPMLDLEDDGGLSQAELTRWVREWVGVVKTATGVPPFLYLAQKIDLDDHFDCPLWVPRYSDAMTPPRVNLPWRTWTAWQFTDGNDGTPKRIPGVSTGYDLSTLNTDDPAGMVETLRIPPPPEPPTVLRVIDWNIKFGRVPAVVLAEVRALIEATNADVVTLQEVSGYDAILKQVTGYTVHQFHTAPGSDETAVLVRDGLEVTNPHAVQVSQDGYRRVTGKLTNPIWAPVVTVEGCTVIAVHTPPTVQTAVQRAAAPNRFRAYRQIIASLRGLVGDGHIVVAGDWNTRHTTTKPADFPATSFPTMGLTLIAPENGPTHDSRTIDYFGVAGVAAVEDVRVIAGVRGSDHRPVGMTVTLP